MSDLTPAQERALMWLPEDGRWKPTTYRVDGAPDLSIMSSARCAGLVEKSGFPPSVDYRLTQAGIEARRAIKDRTND